MKTYKQRANAIACREYYEKHREKIRVQNHERYVKNRKKILARQRARYANDPAVREQVSRAGKAWYQRRKLLQSKP